MAKPLLPDALWEIIEPLLPALPPPGPRGGRPPLPHRQALTGILFVLKTGLPWEDLPAELNCGCGMSCWRRLAGAGKLEWSKCAIDSSSVRAVFGGSIPARAPRTAGRRAASTT